MPITSVQKTAVEEVINSVVATTATRGKRQLSAMFMDLVDRTDWPQYYELIPEPRCLNNIRSGVEKGRYKDAMDVYTDLSLVFWNALFYNEPASQISLDAEALKAVLETEWKKKSVLPIPRTSLPPASAQRVHKIQERVPASTPGPGPASAVVAASIPVSSRKASPIVQTDSTPAASTVDNNDASTKPVPVLPRSAQHQATPEMDVDIMSPEPDGHGDDTGLGAGTERDPESEGIVRQLEKGLPRWPGFGDLGWMNEVNLERITDIIHTIKSYKDIVGPRLAVALEAVPEESTISHLSYNGPVSLKMIESHARVNGYSNAKDFDLVVAQLFEKARRWHEPGTEPYGRVLLLQRLYQALTSSNPPGPPYTSSTNFASLRAGPGIARPVYGADAEGVAGVTTHRVLAKDRTFVDEVHYKGWTVKLADWVHLSNPDDPSRPIIAQVFRCWLSDETLIRSKKGQPGLTVSWYYRPEQTFHPASRTFWEGEVFKTSHFADHPVEDIIEKIACQFTARHIRGRPRPPYWYLGFPLYVCDSRYNDRDRIFVKIKNWNSCVPEEVRKSTEFMPIYPFERMVVPSRHPSPFLVKGVKGVIKGPGGIVDAAEKSEVDKGEGTTNGKKRARKNLGDAGLNKAITQGPNVVGASSQHQYQPLNLSPQIQPHNQRSNGPDRSILTAAGGLAVMGNNVQVEKLPIETTKHFDRDPDTNEVLWFAAPPMDLPRAPAPKYSLTYLHFLTTMQKQQMEHANLDDMADEATPSKRSRFQPPTITETLKTVFKEGI